MGRETASQDMDFGPGFSHFGSRDLGETTGETKWEYGVETFDIRSEEFGLRGKPVTDQTLVITIPLLDTGLDSMAMAIPWATIVTDSGGNRALVVKNAIGVDLVDYADTFTIHPKAMSDNDKSKDINILKCYPIPGPIGFSYSKQGVRVANLKFEAILADNGDFFRIGDPAIAADTTPPTLQSTTPAAAATGVAKASGLTIDFVMSKAIDPKTVNKANTAILTAAGAMFDTYSVSYIAASKTIRLTTSAAMAASTAYTAVLTTGIKDIAGNALAAPAKVTFTTGT